MLVARLRSDNPLGDAPLTYDDRTETFILEGSGEITPARLLNLENRGQLVWVDEACRERVVKAAIARARRNKANRAAARAKAATVAAAAATRETGSEGSGTSAAPAKSEAQGEIVREDGRMVWTKSPVAESRIVREDSRVVWTKSPVAESQPQAAGVAPNRSRRLRAGAIVSVACVAAVVAVGLLFSHQIAHQLALSFTRQATPYTELYFTHPGTLPTSLSVREPKPFRFAVVNHEGRAHTYPYVVTLAGPHGASVVERGTIELKDNRRAVRVVDVVAPERRTVYLITVTITDPLQSIYFRGYS